MDNCKYMNFLPIGGRFIREELDPLVLLQFWRFVVTKNVIGCAETESSIVVEYTHGVGVVRVRFSALRPVAY